MAAEKETQVAYTELLDELDHESTIQWDSATFKSKTERLSHWSEVEWRPLKSNAAFHDLSKIFVQELSTSYYYNTYIHDFNLKNVKAAPKESLIDMLQV